MSKLAELLERTEPLAEDALAEAIEGHPLADVLLTLVHGIRGLGTPAPATSPQPGPEQAGEHAWEG